MAKINIVIADLDELYLNHLTNYLMERMNTWEVYAFTTKESLIKFVGDRSNKIDIIVFTQELMDEVIGDANIPAKIVLSDGSFCELKQFESVKKYQKTDKLINDILMVYAEQTGRVEAVSRGDKQTMLVGFYSPVGGSGKTTLAVAIAYALASQGKRVFYLNAEKLNSTRHLFYETDRGTMSDVYLAVKTKGANIGLRVMANKHTDTQTNISYIAPAESSLEINELTVEEYSKLLGEFEKLGEFDVVIVDFDSELNKEKISILPTMDRIFVPFTSDTLSISKIQLFLKELGMYDELKEIKEKISLVLNKSGSQSHDVLLSNELIAQQGVRTTVAVSPILEDLKNVFRAGHLIVPALSKMLEEI